MPQTTPDWVVNDQTPDNPYGKSTDYEAYLDYLGALKTKLTPEIAAGTIKINVFELNDHPDFKAAAIGALEQWASSTGLEFEIVDDRPFDKKVDYMQVVSPELGEANDGSAYSSGRFVSIGQRFHDTEPNRTAVGGYVFDSLIHEFGHEFGLNHPGLYNYGGPGGVQINYLNNATWVYDRQQYSVMSYFDGIDVGADSRWSASTPLMADMEAVIRHYYSTVTDGVRTYQDIQLNTGDDVYGFGSTKFGYTLTMTGSTHDIGFVIHDTGGHDTIDFTDSTSGTILDLRAGYFSSVNGHVNNVSIFAGHNADGTEYYIETGIGSRFDDTIIGNDGNNVLDGGTGNDHMAGGGGDDTYYVDSMKDVVFETANGGNDTIIVVSGRYSLRGAPNVENIIFDASHTYVYQPIDPPPGPVDPDGGPFGLKLVGNALNNVLTGGDGRDMIHGGGGDDTITGGRDTLASRDINNTIPVADLPDQTESYDRGDDLFGGSGNDVLLGGAGNDLLDGGTGNDTFFGQAGADVFVGGDGSDTVDYSRESPFQLLVNLRTNLAAGGTGSGDTFFGIENLIGSDDRLDRFIGNAAENHFIGNGGGDYFNGGAGNDVLDGGADGDILFGGVGDDLLIGGSGQDALHGGLGNDTASYATSSAAVRVDLGTGIGSRGDAEGPVQIVGVGSQIKGDILVNIENLIGSDFGDKLTGNAGVNVLDGGKGDDTLTGAGGSDQLIGGDGSDTADYSDSLGAVLVNLAAGLGGGDVLISIENAAGSAAGDTLIGDGYKNILVGQGGNDSLQGGGGRDVLVGDFLPVPVSGVGMGDGYTTLPADATNNSAATALDLSNNFTMVADGDIGNSTTVPHTTVAATGNGLAGFYSVTVNANTILTLDIDRTSANLDSWILLVDANGNIVANNDDAGGDPGSVHSTDSQLSFSVLAGGTYTIVVGQWDNGFSAVIPIGATYELNVSVATEPLPPQVGVSGADMLNGGGGDDFIFGGAGDDVLIGGAGSDRLKGGSGSDTFRLDAALGDTNVDRIADFHAGSDMIQLGQSVMAALGSVGALAAAAFYQSADGNAHDGSDRITYNIVGGQLFYDADGNGSVAAIQIASLSTGLDLTADSFWII